jgi:Kef-type K+ transport system membrane component KefB
MMLAGTVGRDHALVRRLRALTFGLLTPFYFIRAGAFVSIPALIAAPFAFIFMLLAKMVSKFVGVYPVTRIYKTPNPEAMYTTLLMSTGLTDFISVRALPWYHQSVAVFDPRRRRDRQRGDPDADRERLLSAAPSAPR